MCLAASARNIFSTLNDDDGGYVSSMYMMLHVTSDSHSVFEFVWGSMFIQLHLLFVSVVIATGSCASNLAV
jgi:hypothetical protein